MRGEACSWPCQATRLLLALLGDWPCCASLSLGLVTGLRRSCRGE